MTELSRLHAHANDLSGDGLTARASVLLGTPLLVSRGLSYFAVDWSPKVPGPDPAAGEPGLYAWVIAEPDAGLEVLLRSPAIYWGKGAGIKGAARRVGDESRWTQGRPLIGHGLAMARTGARPVVGPVHARQESGSWESILPVGVPADAVEVAWPKLAEFSAGLRDPARVLGLVERFAVRVAVCAGDVPAPVNSQYASAWELGEGETDLADIAAWYVVRHLAGGIRGWLDVADDE